MKVGFGAVVIFGVLLFLVRGNEEGTAPGEYQDSEVQHDTGMRQEDPEGQRMQENHQTSHENIQVPKMHAPYSFRPPFKNFTAQGDRYIPSWSIGMYCAGWLVSVGKI